MVRWQRCIKAGLTPLALVATSLLCLPAAGAEQASGPDAYEPNNAPAQAHALGSIALDKALTIHANFHDGDDSDWYSFTTSIGSSSTPQTRITVNVTQPNSSRPVQLVLFDGSSEVARHEGRDHVEATYQWTAGCGYLQAAMCPGTIHLQVKRLPDTPPGPYVLTVASMVPAPPPRIAGFTPKSGASGSRVTITGEHLSGSATVTFGNVAAEVTEAGPTALKVTVPSGAATGPVTVTTKSGTTSSKEPFTLTAPSTAAESPCCTITPAAGKGTLGRLVVRYPAASQKVEAKIEVYKSGERTRVGGGHGNKSLDLAPGLYDVVINGKRIDGVIIKPSHHTHIKTGALHVASDKQTRVDVLDPDGKVISGWSGDKTFGFPVGQVSLKLRGETRTVTIEEGKVIGF